MLTSLIKPEHAQQDLPLAGGSFFDESVVELASGALERLDSRGDHTAARLFAKNQQLYKAIMWLYASGSAGQLKIAEVLKVSVHTVRAVIQREKLSRGAAMDTVKTLQSMSDLREMTLETLIEKLADKEERHKIPFDKLMIGLGIQTEKIELLRGNATERIEHVESQPAADDFTRWVREGSIDVQANETGLSGEECGTKGDRGVGAALALPVARPADPGADVTQVDALDGAAPGPVEASHSIDNVVGDAQKPNDLADSSIDDVSCDVSEPASTPDFGLVADLDAGGTNGPRPARRQGGRGSSVELATTQRDECT
jgi:hypothetical protein